VHEAREIADVLYGDYKPTGKLPVTWPAATSPTDLSQFNLNHGDTPYAPLFAYGFGLTYP
jgi:beta-glucosidase